MFFKPLFDILFADGFQCLAQEFGRQWGHQQGNRQHESG